MVMKMRDLAGLMQRLIGIIFMVLFLPVLFCVFFIGNRMDYFEVCKITCVLDNVVIALFGICTVVPVPLPCSWHRRPRKYVV